MRTQQTMDLTPTNAIPAPSAPHAALSFHGDDEDEFGTEEDDALFGEDADDLEGDASLLDDVDDLDEDDEPFEEGEEMVFEDEEEEE